MFLVDKEEGDAHWAKHRCRQHDGRSFIRHIGRCPIVVVPQSGSHGFVRNNNWIVQAPVIIMVSTGSNVGVSRMGY